MNLKAAGIMVFAIVSAGGGWCQSQYAAQKNVPLYRVTVIERTVKAINYEYRSGPTEIDFRGTVLLPEAKGNAVVESKQGRTELDARFEHVAPPGRYGAEYLTYVLWAITPEGHAKNLGEVFAGSSDRAHLHVTTDLQAFGLIVTAEPYAAVRQPSDVVVMENEVRSDTIGKIEPINAKFDLLPRGEYTYNVPADLKAAGNGGPKVGMNEYEEIVELYQAQNAVQIAGAMGAAEYAGDTFARAQELLRTAQSMRAAHAGKSQVVGNAREAAQTAEDARAITLKRRHDAEVASAKDEAAQERQRRLQAEAEAQTAKAQSSADRVMLDQERSLRQQAEAQAAAQVAAAAAPPTVIVTRETTSTTSTTSTGNAKRQQRDLRMSVYQRLGASSLEVTDSPRGLLVTIPAHEFSGNALQAGLSSRLAPVAEAVNTHPGLAVEIDDNGEGNAARGEAIKMALMQRGVPGSAITVRAMGNGRPIASNGTPWGRELNRRVEIAITGDAIGSLPYWDRSYSVAPR